MSLRNARRLLLIAFAVSILIHLLGVRLVHWQIATPVDVPEKMTISRIVVIHRMKRTPPPKTPAPLPSAAARPKSIHTTKISVPRISKTTGPGRPATTVATATATATPSASPRPVRLPTPVPNKGGCTDPNAPAAVKSAAPIPEIPLVARETAKNGITQVHVRLSDQGSVLEAGIGVSSGSDGLDQIALAMAKSSQYTAALQQCKPVAATYEFRVKFATP